MDTIKVVDYTGVKDLIYIGGWFCSGTVVGSSKSRASRQLEQRDYYTRGRRLREYSCCLLALLYWLLLQTLTHSLCMCVVAATQTVQTSHYYIGSHNYIILYILYYIRVVQPIATTHWCFCIQSLPLYTVPYHLASIFSCFYIIIYYYYILNNCATPYIYSRCVIRPFLSRAYTSFFVLFILFAVYCYLVFTLYSYNKTSYI